MHLAYLQNGRQANIDATRNLIKAIKDSDTRRVIHCSTAVVVGFSAEGVITEETPPLPRGEYQLTKYRIEEILRSELPSNVELAILRPTEIIGPGGQGLRTMIRRIREGRRYRNFVYHCILKSRLFNYVSVYNVVAALIFLATSPIRQQRDIYFLSDDDDADNNYAAVEKMIGSMFHRPTDPLIDVGIPRPLLSFLFKLLPDLAPPHRVYSHAKISSRGYRKVTTLRQTITEIVAMEAVPDISG
jgi:nucleoside-diphosphate-sugar epimerase